LSAGPILSVLGQEVQTAALAGEYLSIAGFGIFPALLVMTLKSFLAALERTQVVFWMTVAGAVTNGLANYALIFGNWGAPEMGVTGAAIASLLTQLVMFGGAAIYAARALPDYALFQRFWRPDTEALWQVFRLGVPIGLTTVSEAGMFAASALMMGWLGTTSLAAHGIVLNITALTFMVHLGLSNVATIRAGNALGRQDVDHLRRGGRTVIVISVIMAVLTTVLFITMPEPLILLFLDPAEPALDDILTLGITLLALSALFQLVDGAQAIALGLLRGIKDTSVPMVLAAFSYWVVGVPMSWLLAFRLGLAEAGVWLGLSFGLAVAALCLNWRFWKTLLPRL
jgi:MATE family multidrug resistance protein